MGQQQQSEQPFAWNAPFSKQPPPPSQRPIAKAKRRPFNPAAAAASKARQAAAANAASAVRIATTESTLLPQEQEQQLPECPICFCEIESAAETWTCGNANHAQHTACTTCLQYHIHSRVEEGMLIMSCPVDYATCAYQLT